MERSEEKRREDKGRERIRERIVARDAGEWEFVPPVQRREVFILARDRVQ